MIALLKKFGKKAQNPRPFTTAIVPAAGSATRMEGTDKVLTLLEGVPVLVHTLGALERCQGIDQIILVTREDLIPTIGTLCKEYSLGKVTKIIRGGAERCHSVLAGLNEVEEATQLVAIHDGARPFPTEKLLAEVLARGAETGAAAPGVPVVDTIKQVDGGLVARTLPRETLWAVQTPQVFQAGLIKTALSQAIEENIPLTDDCSAVERLGMKVSITQGDYQNIKITTPLDLHLAQGILRQREEKP